MKEWISQSLPVAATEIAARWDSLYFFLIGVSAVFFAIVMIPMVVFAIKYRARPGHKADPSVVHNTPLEIVWTAIPTVIVMIIFVWGWVVYRDMIHVNSQAPYEVRVVAQSWAWIFQYEDGRTTTNQLFVPENTAVKLTMTAKKNDVLHSFWVPNFRIKQDVVPGQYTYATFQTPMVGQHTILCTEYCGAGHSLMLGSVVVLPKKDFELWKWGKDVAIPPFIGLGLGQVAAAETVTEIVTSDLSPAASLVKQGMNLSQSKGCTACHSDDGSSRIGPTYKGVFGAKVTLQDGTVIVADENYIRESILEPQAKIVKGYEAVLMPPYVGQIDEMEMNALVAYFKSLN